MTEFTARKTSEAVVPHARRRVWDVLVDPDLVASMTPMVGRIVAEGDRWHWSLRRIPVLGTHHDLDFTERMEFDPHDRIVFTHAPRGPEHAGVDGRYDLADGPAGPGGAPATRLAIDLAITVDLPLPRLSRPVVQTAMHGVLEVMGAGFARGLERHLASH